MTVSELIEELQKFPGHHPIMCKAKHRYSITHIEGEVLREEMGPVVVINTTYKYDDGAI